MADRKTSGGDWRRTWPPSNTAGKETIYARSLRKKCFLFLHVDFNSVQCCLCIMLTDIIVIFCSSRLSLVTRSTVKVKWCDRGGGGIDGHLWGPKFVCSVAEASKSLCSFLRHLGKFLRCSLSWCSVILRLLRIAVTLKSALFSECSILFDEG